MKKIFIILVIVSESLFSQTKIATDIYMQNDPSHVAKTYKTVVFKSNTEGEINDAIIKVFKKFNINAISYYSLFPALKEYNEEEMNKILDQNHVDAKIVINAQFDSYIRNITFNSYGPNSSNATFNNTTTLYFSMFFSDINTETPFVRVDGHLLSNGGLKRRDVPLAMKFTHNSLNGLIEKGVIIKPIED